MAIAAPALCSSTIIAYHAQVRAVRPWGTAIALLLFSLLSVEARAGKREALQLYERGESAYNAQRFAESIELFERAYAEHPAPEFLFNIAQAHRRLGHCEEALVFYRRYLEQLPNTKLRAEVEGHVAKLRAQCIEPLDLPKAHTEEPQKPVTQTATIARVQTNEPAPPSQQMRHAEYRASWFFVGSVASGVAVISVPPYSIPVQLSLKADAGPRFTISENLAIEAVLRIQTAALPYQSELSEGTARDTDVGASLALAYRFVDRVEGRVAAGGGVSLLSGLGSGNPFTGDRMAHGSIALPSAQFAIGARVLIVPSIFVSGEAAYAISPSSDDQVNEGATTRIDLLAGVGLLL